MADLITESSDPTLWYALKASYASEGNPGNVCRGGRIYKVHTLMTEEVAFQEIENLDYIDSRSLTKSKKATYKKLDG